MLHKIRYIFYWCSPEYSVRWREIELNLSYTHPSPVQIKWKRTCQSRPFGWHWVETLGIWNEVIQIQNHRRLQTFNSHSHSLRFKPGLVDNVFVRWRYRGSTIVERHFFKSLEMLQREFDLEKGDLIRNLQLRHFCETEVKKVITTEDK